MKKAKAFLYNIMDKLGNRVMHFIFICGFILIVIFIGLGTFIPELNRQTYEGKIVQKYGENHSVTTGKTYFIEVQQGNKTVKIENADILLHQKFDSEDIHKEIKEGQTAKIDTIGFNAPKWGLYPNLTHIEQK